MTDVSDRFLEKIKHTFYVQYRFSENHDVFEILWENMTDPGSPRMIIHGACAMRTG